MTDAGQPNWIARSGARDWRAPAAIGAPIDFHRSLPGYQPTPLTETPRLAAGLEVGRVFVKDESSRLGLPAFKILGASWAIERALADNSDAVRTLVAATDGNHGRAVARVAVQRGLGARIFIPDGVHESAVAAIAAEGAEIVRAGGSYDEAVELAVAAATADDALLIQDMGWPGYTEIPAWIVEGYLTMFAEIDGQLAAAGAAPADLVVVPIGVGSLAQAAVTYYRHPGITRPPALLSAEPGGAACGLRSLQAGQMVTVPTSVTIMAGLNCGTLSEAAWPYLSGGLDAAVAVTDQQDAAAARDLAASGGPAGPGGAAALAGARVALTGDGSAARRTHLGVTRTSALVLICTEGSAANPVRDHA